MLSSSVSSVLVDRLVLTRARLLSTNVYVSAPDPHWPTRNNARVLTILMSAFTSVGGSLSHAPLLPLRESQTCYMTCADAVLALPSLSCTRLLPTAHHDDLLRGLFVASKWIMLRSSQLNLLGASRSSLHLRTWSSNLLELYRRGKSIMSTTLLQHVCSVTK